MSIDTNLRDEEVGFLKDYFKRIGFEDVYVNEKYGNITPGDDSRYYTVEAKTTKESVNTRAFYLGFIEWIDFDKREVRINISTRDLNRIRFLIEQIKNGRN